MMRLITTDKYMPNIEAILVEYGEIIYSIHSGRRGRQKKPYRTPKPLD